MDNNHKYQSRSLQEYYIKVVEIKDPYIGNGWGWFVDLDLTSFPKSKPIKIIQNYKSSQIHLNTIKEYPSIRSMKSMTNLHQMNNQMNNHMNNQMNNHMNNHKNFYKYSNFICINLIGIITFAIIYYIID